MADIQLLSKPFKMVPIQIKVRRTDVPGGKPDKWDYVELISPQGKVFKYQWCEKKDVINFDPGAALYNGEIDRDSYFDVAYFTDGGYVSKGKRIFSKRFNVRCPLRHFEAKVDGFLVEARYELLTEIPNCSVVLLAQSVRVAATTLPGDAPINGRVHVETPRVGGLYNLCFRIGKESRNTVKQVHVQVYPGSHNRYELMLGRAVDGGARSAAVCATPGEVVRVHCGGALRADDAVFLIKNDQPGATPDTPISVEMLQTAAKEHRFSIDAGQKVAAVAAKKDGLYHVCLALRHESAYLAAETGLMLVSAKCAARETTVCGAAPLPPPAQPMPAAPVVAPPPPPLGHGGNDDATMCVVCQDSQICMLVRPCNHLSLCEHCCGAMATIREAARCPICRGPIKGTEKVFLP